jgi:hypothetical protein
VSVVSIKQEDRDEEKMGRQGTLTAVCVGGCQSIPKVDIDELSWESNNNTDGKGDEAHSGRREHRRQYYEVVWSEKSWTMIDLRTMSRYGAESSDYSHFDPTLTDHPSESTIFYDRVLHLLSPYSEEILEDNVPRSTCGSDDDSSVRRIRMS